MTERLVVSPAELFGDGVFETVHLRPDGPWLLDRHLDRLTRSARLLDLTLPPRTDIAERVSAAVTGFHGGEGALRIICTRQALHVTVGAVPAEAVRERRTGIRLVSASAGRPAPWSLAGAKVLSYAPNFAARRWARARGADDLLWLTPDGYALEGPTSSLVWLAGDELGTVPDEAGILPGTTAARLLELAGPAGLHPARRMITIDELRTVDGIWLASALRGLAEAVSVDGVPRNRSPWTARLLDLLGYPAG